VFISHFCTHLAYKPSVFTESTRSTKCFGCVYDSWPASKHYWEADRQEHLSLSTSSQLHSKNQN